MPDPYEGDRKMSLRRHDEEGPPSRTVCYFIPTKYKEQYDMARNMVKLTWGQYSKDNIFWVFSHFQNETISLETNEIFLTTEEEYKTLPRKILRMWEYISETYETIWKK
eukprot:UN22678